MIDLRQFEALTFDCYGTLIDWETGILDALEAVRDRHGVEMGDEAVLAAFAQSEAEREASMPGAPYPQILESVYRDLVDRWDVTARDDDAVEFAASVGDWPAFSDTVAALKYLKKHFEIAVLSNVDRASFARSAKRLVVKFDVVMTAEDIGSYKPDLRNFEYAIEQMAQRGVARDKILHVAQSLYHDHVPAKQLGISTVWVDRRAGKSGSGAWKAPQVDVEPDLIVEDLAEFVDLHRRA